MSRLRDGSQTLLGDGSPRSGRLARKTLLLGVYVVAGWFGLSTFGAHHAAEAATVSHPDSSVTVAAPASTPAGVLGAVTASALPGSTAADAAPSTDAVALPRLSDLPPVRDVLGARAASTPSGGPAPKGADPGSSTPIVGGLADRVTGDLTGRAPAAIGRPVEETLTAVTAPIQSLHRSLISRLPAPVTRIVGGAPEHPSAVRPPAEPIRHAQPSHPARAQATAATRAHRTSVPASEPATTATFQSPGLPYGSGHYRISSFPAAVHLSGATQQARGWLSGSGAGAPAAPLQNPGTIPAVAGGVAVAGTSAGPQVGSGFTGSAIPADQIDTAYPAAVHTMRHDNARIARSEAAQPACSPD